MPSTKAQIKEYNLQADSNSGAVVKPLNKYHEASHQIDRPHRDDHYQLLFAAEGSYHFQIDFESISIMAPFVLCIEPGQVHHTVKSEHMKGWALGVEPAFLEDEFRYFLDNKNNQLIKIQSTDLQFLQNMNGLLNIAYQLQSNNTSVYTSKSALLLINAVFCLLIDKATHTPLSIKETSKEKRAYIIGQQFRALLKEKYKDWKSPSQYAQALSVSTSHLNDTIKEITGKSVSLQIQEHNITEAKRLLYFTDLEVREVAYQLGYEDPIYFGKLFKKLTTITPLAFRNQFRD